MQNAMARSITVSPTEAAKRIAESQTLAVVLPESPGIEVVGAAAALISGLRSLGKVISVFAPPTDDGIGPWSTLAADEEPLREFIISFDLARSPIKELKYERGDNRLNIILSPTGRIRREDVEFRWGELRYDLVITLGASSPEAVGASLRKAPELIHEKPVLNIDAAPENKRYGELNLVPLPDAPERPTLAETTEDLLTALNVSSDDAERATALFLALAAATGEFRPQRTSARAFRLAGELRDRGADPAAISHALTRHPRIAEAQLAGRAMARSRIESEFNILWALLTAEDISKTATGPQNIAGVLEHLRLAMPGLNRYALLWQDPADGMVRVRMENTAGEAQPLDGGGAVFPSFATAEEHIRRLLRETDTVE